jgi:rhomboid protease GluP
MQRRPWLTYALIAVNGLVWLFLLSQGGAIGRTPADILLQWGGNAASEVQKGEYWRLFSALFLHSGLVHLLMNMIGLYTAGVGVEHVYGRRLYLLIYFGAGLTGSALSLHFSAQQAVSVGASGAVFGVTGALLVAIYLHRQRLPNVIGRQALSGLAFFIVYALILGWSLQGIDNAAHVGGLLGGALAAFILPARFDPAGFQRLWRQRGVAALLGLAAGLLALVAMAPQASLDQRRVLASAEMLRRGLENFDHSMHGLLQESTDIKAGKLSEAAAEERGRRIFAPRFRSVAAELAQVVFRPGDPREPFVRDVQRLAELLAESLAMASPVDPEGQRFGPAEARRAAQIAAELTQVSARIEQFMPEARQP